ncbi:MAG: lipocalin family protein [Bacteroidota bacterium]
MTTHLLLSRRTTWMIVGVLALSLQSCSLGVPTGITPVTNFEVDRYLGTWYEIARFNHRFEQGLEQVTATYTLKKNGSIRVENAGVNTQTKKQKTAVGKAKFVADKHIGHLKVSFFGPFYGSYIVFHLEPDYSVAMVCGNSRAYCWILARKPVLTPEELAKYQKIAQDHGFDVDQFIYPAPANAAAM